MVSTDTVKTMPKTGTKMRSKKKKEKIINTILFLVLLLGSLVMIVPLLWMVSTSVKNKLDVFAMPPVWIPTEINWSKYSEIWTKGPLLSGLINSLKVCLSVTIVGTFTSSLAAFAFAKLRFPYKNQIFLALLGTMMIPFAIVMIPQFIIFSKIGWVDSLKPLIIPGLFGNVSMIFFLRQYMQGIPTDLIEAARIDGLSEVKIFVKIFMPTMKSTYAAAIVVTFMTSWNNYLWPLIALQSPEKRTLPLVLSAMGSSYTPDYGMMMTAVVIATLPTALIFFVMQKQFVAGMTGSVKG